MSSVSQKIRRSRSPGLRGTLTAFLGLFSGLVLLIFSSVLYQVLVADQEREFDNALYIYAVDLGRNLDVSIFGEFTLRRDVLLDSYQVFPFSTSQTFLQVVNQKGQILAKSPSLFSAELPVSSDNLTTLTTLQPFTQEISNPVPTEAKLPRITYRMISFPIERVRSGRVILQVAAPDGILRQQRIQLLRFFFLAIPTTLLGMGIGIYYITGLSLNPVRRMIQKARTLGARDLTERLPVPETSDELADLAMTLNELLGRLAAAFTAQERFVADASHQLRTPLAILKGEIDVFQKRDRSPAETRSLVESLSGELNHLNRLVNDLLLLARVEQGGGALSFETIRVDEIAGDCVSLLQKMATLKGVSIRFDLDQLGADDFVAQGDGDLIKTMIQSLIENAVKYADPDSTIGVRLRSQGEELILSVENRGPVIPERIWKSIFQPFFREDRQSTTEGMGLGLAIVRRVSEAHGGIARVLYSQADRTCFEVRMKKS